MKKFFQNNSLSVCFAVLFMLSIAGQCFFGFKEYNKEITEMGALPIPFDTYLSSGHFIQATFENWESEFLQMMLYVIFTIFLQQKGSSESKDFDKNEPVDREPNPLKQNAPWPVKKGGFIFAVYKYSLTIALGFLFIISFVAHFFGSLKDENLQLSLKGLPPESAVKYSTDSRFWFESFQNWQSEFLSIFAIIILTIFLRQRGSSQSKPVDAPNNETGD